MRRVVWEDRNGFLRASLIRDNDPDDVAEKGIPVEPPDLEGIDWEEVKRLLHNELVRRQLFTFDDVQREQRGITVSVVSVMRRKIVELYRLNGGGE